MTELFERAERMEPEGREGSGKGRGGPGADGPREEVIIYQVPTMPSAQSPVKGAGRRAAREAQCPAAVRAVLDAAQRIVDGHEPTSTTMDDGEAWGLEDVMGGLRFHAKTVDWDIGAILSAENVQYTAEKVVESATALLVKCHSESTGYETIPASVLRLEMDHLQRVPRPDEQRD